MKNVLILICAILCVSAGWSQKVTDTIRSQKLEEDRIIHIGLPASYQSNPQKKYPLLILLDGDYLFDAFQGALNYGNYWEDIPEMITVGVAMEKTREEDCASDSESGLPSGKGEKFFEFMGELVAALEKQYRVAPFKIIAGHDVTAGFINYYLYKDAPLFNAYISMSPEFPVAMEEHLPQRLAALQQPAYYYMCTADGDVKKMQKLIKTVDETVRKLPNPQVLYRFDEFKGASHYSLVLHAIPSALYHFFGAYQPISTNEFNEKIAVLPTGHVDYLMAKYTTIEKMLGTKLTIRINDFKAIEAAILKNKAYAELDKLSDLARKNYPKSMLPDYHLGLMYEKQGDPKRAAKAYQSGFQKEEIGDLTKDFMLEKADAMKGM